MARILGLEFDQKEVRGALVRTSFRQSELVQYVSRRVAKASDPDALREAQAEALRALLEALGTPPPEKVVVAFPGTEASLRSLSFPPSVGRRVAEVLPFEIEALLPFALEEAVIDQQPLRSSPEGVEVLAAAARRDRVALFLESFHALGVHPHELAVGAAALDGLRWILPTLQEPSTTVLLDFRGESTDLCVLHAGNCELARTLSVGSHALEAGHFREIDAALRQTLSAYRSQRSAEVEIARVFVSGEASLDAPFLGWLSEVFAAEVLPLPLPPIDGADDRERPRFARVVALAGRAIPRNKRIDFMRGDFAPKRSAQSRRASTGKIALAAAAVFAAYLFSNYAQWTTLKSESEVLEAELERVSGEVFGEPTRDPERIKNLMQGSDRNQGPLPELDAFDVIDAISARIPTSITHDTRTLSVEVEDAVNGGHFEIEGTVDTIAERDAIATQLEGFRCFRDLEKGRTAQAPGSERLNYALEASVRCGPASKAGKGGDKP